MDGIIQTAKAYKWLNGKFADERIIIVEKPNFIKELFNKIIAWLRNLFE